MLTLRAIRRSLAGTTSALILLGVPLCGFGLLGPHQSGDQLPRFPDRTKPFLERMTPVQVHHSKLYDDFKTRSRPLDTGWSITRTLEWRDSRRTEWHTLQLPTLVHNVKCPSDGSFLGTVLSAVSNPIADGTFLFTDYEVRLDEVFRMPPAPVRRVGATVVVTRPGGRLTVDGTTVQAVVSDMPLLALNKQYVFSAHQIAETLSFQTVHQELFEVDGERAHSIRPLPSADGDLSTPFSSRRLLELFRQVSCRPASASRPIRSMAIGTTLSHRDTDL
jgi:hypothetical protein